MLGRFSARQRFYGTVFGVFALAALMLSAIGVYGIVGYSVVQRQRELALRLALGAQGAHLVRRVVGWIGGLAAAGIVVGSVGAWLLARSISSLLFQTGERDTATFLTAAGLIAIVALLAGWIPAWRLRRLDPATVLRDS